MADFTAGNVGSTMDSAVTAKNPVVKSDAALVSALGAAVQRSDSLFASNAKDAAETAKNRTLAQFQAEAFKLSQAVDQGTMSAKQADSEARRRLNQAISSNPALINDFNKIYKDIRGEDGIARELAGTEHDKQIDTVVSQALADGFYIDLAQGRPQIEKQAMSYLEIQKQKSVNDALKSEYELNKSRLDLSAAERREAEEELKLQARQGYGNMIAIQNKELQTMADAVLRDVANGTIKEEEGLATIRVAAAKIHETTASMQDLAGASSVASTTALIDRTVQLYEDHITGKLGIESRDRQLKNLQVASERRWMMDPELADLTTGSRLFGHNNPTLTIRANNAVARRFSEQAGPGPKPSINAFETPEKFDDYRRTLEESLRNATKDGDQTAINEGAQHFESMFRHADQYAAMSDRVSDMKGVVNLLASPTFMSVMDNQQITPQSKQKMQEVLIAYFADGIGNLMSSELGKAAEVGPRDEFSGSQQWGTVNDLVEPRIVAGEVRFYPTDSKPSSMVLARKLNTSVAARANETVRAIAHLEGSTDYASYIEGVFGVQLGLVDPNAPKTGGEEVVGKKR